MGFGAFLHVFRSSLCLCASVPLWFISFLSRSFIVRLGHSGGNAGRLCWPGRFNEGMAFLHLEPLPARTRKGELLGLLDSTGGLRRERVGRIELQGSRAMIEVPDEWAPRLVTALDGISFKERKLRVWSSGSPVSGAAGADHFVRLARLLTLESEAEAQQTLETSKADGERRGDFLTRL